MATISAAESRDDIGKLWETAAREPVTVVRAGRPIAVVISPDEYAALSGVGRPAQAGFAKHLLSGVDVRALLDTPIEDVFEGYL